mmetsp:Transcript_7458/g.29735  ORF Transcript_7458/g.29735 Transcript_7458/m.29735 type:complete len:233 (-) Transcript_7458:496-1194(-)
MPVLKPSGLNQASCIVDRSRSMLRCTSDTSTSPRASSPHAKYVCAGVSTASSALDGSTASLKRASAERGSPGSSLLPTVGARPRPPRPCARRIPAAAMVTAGLSEGTRNCIPLNGTRFVVISLRSTLSGPGKRMPAVRPVSMRAASSFIESKAPLRSAAAACALAAPGAALELAPERPASVAARSTIDESAPFSTGMTQSACSDSCASARAVLYGDVTTSSSSLGNTGDTNR